MGFFVHVQQVLQVQVGVFLSRGKTLVTQQLLNRSEIGTVVEQVGGDKNKQDNACHDSQGSRHQCPH